MFLLLVVIANTFYMYISQINKHNDICTSKSIKLSHNSNNMCHKKNIEKPIAVTRIFYKFPF